MNKLLNFDTWVKVFPQVSNAKVIIYFSYWNIIFHILSSGSLISPFGYETNADYIIYDVFPSQRAFRESFKKFNNENIHTWECVREVKWKSANIYNFFKHPQPSSFVNLPSYKTENIEGCWKYERIMWGGKGIKMEINLFHHWNETYTYLGDPII